MAKAEGVDEALKAADEKGAPQADVVHRGNAGRRLIAFNDQNQHASHHQHHADDQRRKKHGFDVAMQRCPHNAGRNERNDQREHKMPGVGVVVKMAQHPPQPCAIQPADRQDGTELYDNLKGSARGRFKSENIDQQDQMAGGRNRQKFSDPLDRAKKYGLNQCRYIHHGESVQVGVN